MPPDRDRGRASKACNACRKQKTRCYEADSNSATCLRCHTLRLQCSLSEGRPPSLDLRGPERDEGLQPSAYDDRLSRLERTVAALVRKLDDRSNDAENRNELTAETTVHVVEGPSPAPVVLLRDVATEVGVSPEEHRQTPLLSSASTTDIISSGLINTEVAVSLISLFQEHYGRWVSFDPRDNPTTLLMKLKRSPLLLCACVLIAVRHTSIELASNLASPLFKEAKALLSNALLTVPQSFDFFRAAVILSFWSTTIGQTPLSLDSWLLSGFALQQSMASDVFKSSRRAHRGLSGTREELDRLCVWNHLCLVHLHYCVGTRRQAVINRSHIEQSRLILDSDHATNFEVRLVAEIYLYWIIYEHCYTHPVDLPKTQTALRAWKDEWDFLFEQPRATFLQMGLHFAQLVAYDQSLKSRSAAVRESLLSEMVRLSSAIIKLAMDTTDDRTRHLSDHIYHLITFAAVTICRLLHMYEKQLAVSHNLEELDQLVLTLATWLHSVGPSCHVAHTFGDVVAAFHKKLRPDAQPTSPTLSYQEAEPVIDPDFASLFPDLLTANLFDGPTPQLLPDWDPFVMGGL